MIRTGGQLKRTEREIERFKERLKGLRKKDSASRLIGLQARSIRKAMRQLERQVRLYRDAVRGRVSLSDLEGLLSSVRNHGRPRIGEAIFLLRTSKGVTQAGLARKVGTQREAIARWERDDYTGYTLETLQRIFEALGYRLGIRVHTEAS